LMGLNREQSGLIGNKGCYRTPNSLKTERITLSRSGNDRFL
jgi:hypothetical protein